MAVRLRDGKRLIPEGGRGERTKTSNYSEQGHNTEVCGARAEEAGEALFDSIMFCNNFKNNGNGIQFVT